MVHLHNPRGVLMVEIILTIAIFAVMATGAIYFLSANVYSAQASANRTNAASYLQQGVEAVQAIDRAAWNALADSPDSTYGLQQTSGVWSLADEPDNPDGNTDYTRTITIADVYRNADGDIVDSSTPDAELDPHTRAVTVLIEWSNGPIRSSDISSVVYLTDWDSTQATQDLTTDFSTGTLNNLRISEIDDGELQIIQAPMEVGTVTATTAATTVLLDNEYDNPVVVTSVLDGNNPNSPVTSRVTDVTSTSFELKLDFPTDNFLPSTTNSETVYYVVVEAGTWNFGDNNTRLEAGIVEDVSAVACNTACSGYNVGTDVPYELEYTTNPLVFHQIITNNDTDWITSYVSDNTSNANPPGTDGFQVAMNGAQVTTSHDPEDVAYIVIESEAEDVFEGINFETDATGDIVQGQANSHHSENLDQTYGATPWALVTKTTEDGGDGAWAMLDSISSTRITMYAEEDQTTDTERSHTTEDFGYWVMAEEGTYYLDAEVTEFDHPKMEVGVIESIETGAMEIGTATATSSWTTIPLTNTYIKPVVQVTILDGNNPNSPVTTRVRNASGNSFDVKLQFPTDSFAPVTTNSETIYYMVVEAGVWELGDTGIKLEADIAEDVSRLGCGTCGYTPGTVITYDHAYTTAPLVFHQVMSENDTDWITSYASDDSIRSTPPQTDAFQLSMMGAQSTSSHDPEDIGYIVFQSEATDTASGVPFETDSTGDSVLGYSDAHRTEVLDNTYTSTPVALVSQNSMDGSDGAWAMLDTLTTTDITMYVDEDQTVDTERSHASEDVGYVVFGQTGNFTLNDWSFLRDPITVELEQTYTNPVVVTMPYITSDLHSPFSTRVYDVQPDSFTLRLDFPPDNFGTETLNYSEPVYYMVMEEGQWQMGDMKVEAHLEEDISTVAYITSWTGEAMTYDHTYTNNPLIFHQVMSDDDPTWISSWVSAPSRRTNPPTTAGFDLALNATQVSTSYTHAPEDIGWIAFEDVSLDEYEGTEFRTHFGRDAMRGNSDSCTTYTHGGTYVDGGIILASQMGMDGIDGTWISACSVSDTAIGFQAEEDQSFDSERSHTDEDYALMVFEESFDTAGGSSDVQTIGTYESDIIDISSIGRNFNIIEWLEQTDCTDCDVSVQVRTSDSSSAVGSATYVGPDGTNATVFDNPVGDLLNIDHINDTYMQYFLTLEGTTAESPILEDVTYSYYEQ